MRKFLLAIPLVLAASSRADYIECWQPTGDGWWEDDIGTRTNTEPNHVCTIHREDNGYALVGPPPPHRPILPFVQHNQSIPAKPLFRQEEIRDRHWRRLTMSVMTSRLTLSV